MHKRELAKRMQEIADEINRRQIIIDFQKRRIETRIQELDDLRNTHLRRKRTDALDNKE